MKRRVADRRERPVCAVNPDGSLNAYYTSITEAAKILGAGRNTISYAVNHGTTSYGLRWYPVPKHRELWMKGGEEGLAFTPTEGRNIHGRWVKGHGPINPYRNMSAEKRAEVIEKKRRFAREQVLDPASSFGKASVRKEVRCVETGKTWPSVKACAEEIGVKQNTMSTYLTRGIPRKGYHYERTGVTTFIDKRK